MEAGVWSLDGQRSVRKTLLQDLKDEKTNVSKSSSFSAISIPLDDNEYGLAYEAGMRMAEALNLDGGQAILQEAKMQVEKMRTAN